MSHRRLYAHATVVVLLASAGSWAHYTAEDASIGGGLALLTLIALGLPWSAVPFLTFETNGDWPSTATYTVLALLNAAALHAAAAHIGTRRMVHAAADPHPSGAIPFDGPCT